MKFLLDTNAVIALLKGDEALVRPMRRHRPADFCLPSVVAHELYYGAFRSRRTAHNLARVEALPFEVLPLDLLDARAAADLRAVLAARGQPIGPYDVLIAGQALARGLTLITGNRAEFERVPGLKLVNWLSANSSNASQR